MIKLKIERIGDTDTYSNKIAEIIFSVEVPEEILLSLISNISSTIHHHNSPGMLIPTIPGTLVPTR